MLEASVDRSGRATFDLGRIQRQAKYGILNGSGLWTVGGTELAA